MDVLFLDVNVLFSASYRADSGLQRLWHMEGVRLVTSSYAAEEARRNLDDGPPRERLGLLLEAMEIVAEPSSGSEAVQSGIDLPEKDVPILRAAVLSGASHLITGDLAHFGRHFGQMIAGVRIVRPGAYLRARR